MSDCQMPAGCILHEPSGACSLCDEDGADRIAEWQSQQQDWMRQRTPEEIRQDMVEGAKAFGASAESAERFVAHLTGEKPMSDRDMMRMILECSSAPQQARGEG
jgi:hypothetical protein